MIISKPQQLPESQPLSDSATFATAEDVAGVAFVGARFSEIDRSHLSVQSCSFTSCLFAGGALPKSQFSDVVFRNCDLSNADWRGCSFHRVEFVDCKLMGTNLCEVTWNNVSLVNCKAELANFTSGRMRVVSFDHALMRSAAFDECRFERVEFVHCDLAMAEFHRTRLKNISLADSDIRGIRVGEIDSFELKGLIISQLQALDLVRLLGVEIEDA
ncbi:MAG: pentapeptide repeat-containing protein [Alistipes sp.]